MLDSLKNKSVLIVGGASGLGYAIAESFLKCESRVVIASRNINRLKESVQSLKTKTNACVSCEVVDVNAEESVIDLQKRLNKNNHVVDVLVCSHGVHLKKLFLDTNSKEWKKIIETNLFGTYHLNRVFGEMMCHRKKGVIINIASLASAVALSETSAYNVSKSAVSMLSKSLAVEWAKDHVRVNTIIPGVFETELNQKALKDSKRLKNILQGTPMNRLGQLSEIGSAALFLASDEASFVTGSEIVVDGGFLAYSGY